MDLVNSPGLDVSGAISNVNRLVSVAAANEIKESLISDGVTAGVLTIAKTGSTARIVTFPDAAITVARIDAAQTFTGQSTFTDGIISSHCDAATVAGMHIGNNTHQDVAMFGAGGGQGTTLYGQLNCLAVDSTSATGIITRQAATQDAIQLLGRAGGASSYVGSITTTTLTASRTYTLPDASIIVAGSASALTSGRVPHATTGGLLIDTANFLDDGATKVTIGYTTASTTTGTGALVVSGGVGVAGNIYSGGYIDARTASAASQTFASTGSATSNYINHIGNRATNVAFCGINAYNAAYSTAAQVGTIYFNRDGADRQCSIIFGTDNGTAYGERMRIGYAGSLMVGTTTDHGKLSVKGGSALGTVDSDEFCASAGSAAVASGGAFYLGSAATDGSWKIERVGNDLAFFRRESGSYVEKGRMVA